MDFYTSNDITSDIITEKEFLTEFSDANFFNLTTLHEDFPFKNEKNMDNFNKLNSVINKGKASFDNQVTIYSDNSQLYELESISYINSQHNKDIEKSYYNKLAEQENLYYLNANNMMNNNNDVNDNNINNNNNTFNNNLNNANKSEKSNKSTMSYNNKNYLNSNTVSFSISKNLNNTHPSNASYQQILPNSIITSVNDNTFVLHNTANAFKPVENNHNNNIIINTNDGSNIPSNSNTNVSINPNNNALNSKNNFNASLTPNNLNITNSNNNKSYSCPSCNKNFSSEKYLSMHMSLHKPLNNPTLNTNPQNFGKSPLKVEDFLSQGISPIEKYKGKGSGKAASWTCKICMKTFAQNSNYKNHIRTHSNERPYECTLCSIGFKERYHLKKHHLYVHSNQMNEKCGVCHKMFKDSTAVRAHLRTHSELRPYHCSRCGKAFKTSECLWHHENKSKTCAKNILNKGITDLRKIIPKPMKNRNRNKLKTSVELVDLQNGSSEIKIENIVNGFSSINPAFQLNNTYNINSTINTSNNNCGFYGDQQNGKETMETFETKETHESVDNNSINATAQNNPTLEHTPSLTPMSKHTTVFYSSPTPYRQIKLSSDNNAQYNNTSKYTLPSSTPSLNNFYPQSYNIFIANNNTYNLINNNLENQPELKNAMNNDENNFNEYISVTTSINSHGSNTNYTSSINNNLNESYINVSNHNFSHLIKVGPSFSTIPYEEKNKDEVKNKKEGREIGKTNGESKEQSEPSCIPTAIITPFKRQQMDKMEEKFSSKEAATKKNKTEECAQQDESMSNDAQWSEVIADKAVFLPPFESLLAYNETTLHNENKKYNVEQQFVNGEAQYNGFYSFDNVDENWICTPINTKNNFNDNNNNNIKQDNFATIEAHALIGCQNNFKNIQNRL